MLTKNISILDLSLLTLFKNSSLIGTEVFQFSVRSNIYSNTKLLAIMSSSFAIVIRSCYGSNTQKMFLGFHYIFFL